MEAIREAKKRGVDVIAETCSHYLTLTQEKNAGEDGILYLMSPPLRSQEDQDALWEGLADGTLSLVTSDNCSFPRWMKEESLDRGADGKVVQDFTKVISGVSGIEERFGLMLHEVGRHKGFTLEKVAEVLCENPAKVFGCYPRKGCLQVGSDGDVTVVNLSDNSYKLTLDNLHYPVYGQDGVGKAGLEYAVSRRFRRCEIDQKAPLRIPNSRRTACAVLLLFGIFQRAAPQDLLRRRFVGRQVFGLADGLQGPFRALKAAGQIIPQLPHPMQHRRAAAQPIHIQRQQPVVERRQLLP